jgi:hypothetical protein
MGGKSSKTTNNYTMNINELTNNIYNKNNIDISLKDSISQEQHIENVKNLISNVVVLTMTDIMSDMNFDFDQHNQVVRKFAKDPATGLSCQYDTIISNPANRPPFDLSMHIETTVSNISNNDIGSKVSKKMIATIDMATQLVKKLGLEKLIKNNGNSQESLDSKTNSINSKSEIKNSGTGGLEDVAGSMFAFGSSKTDNITFINNTDIRNSITNKNTKNIDKKSKYRYATKNINKIFENKNSNEEAINKISNAFKTAMTQRNSFDMIDIPCVKMFDVKINQENNMLRYIRQKAITDIIVEIAKKMTENSFKEIDSKFSGDTRKELKDALKNITKLASEASSSMVGSNEISMEDKILAIEVGMDKAIKYLGEGINIDSPTGGSYKFLKYFLLIIILALIIFLVIKFVKKNKK